MDIYTVGAFGGIFLAGAALHSLVSYGLSKLKSLGGVAVKDSEVGAEDLVAKLEAMLERKKAAPAKASETAAHTAALGAHTSQMAAHTAALNAHTVALNAATKADAAKPDAKPAA